MPKNMTLSRNLFLWALLRVDQVLIKQLFFAFSLVIYIGICPRYSSFRDLGINQIVLSTHLDSVLQNSPYRLFKTESIK